MVCEKSHLTTTHVRAIERENILICKSRILTRPTACNCTILLLRWRSHAAVTKLSHVARQQQQQQRQPHHLARDDKPAHVAKHHYCRLQAGCPNYCRHWRAGRIVQTTSAQRRTHRCTDVGRGRGPQTRNILFQTFSELLSICFMLLTE